jgi:hypothetical protein
MPLHGLRHAEPHEPSSGTNAVGEEQLTNPQWRAKCLDIAPFIEYSYRSLYTDAKRVMRFGRIDLRDETVDAKPDTMGTAGYDALALARRRLDALSGPTTNEQ